MSDNHLRAGSDGRLRCAWFGGLDDYQAYHDDEWGHPIADDKRLFEKICLEGFQSGLSWLTILRKRENFRAAFAGFDFEKIARFTDEDVGRLVQDKGIIRHQGKIRSTINNARRACDLVDKEGSLAKFIWSFEPDTHDHHLMQTTSPESIALSKELKKRGWSFVGPTTMYAFLQSMGVVNDHIEGCCFHEVIEAKRAAFKRP
ncbi:MAG: DNA-3-methyladenine glycosylase I [Sphingomonadales bacterium]